MTAGRVLRGSQIFARLDRAGGFDGTERDPITGLGRRPAAGGLRNASLDEVLCIAGA